MNIFDLSTRTGLYLKLACEWRSWKTEGGYRGRRKTGMALLPERWTHACLGCLVQLAPFRGLSGPEVSTGAAVHTDAAAAAAVASNIGGGKTEKEEGKEEKEEQEERGARRMWRNREAAGKKKGRNGR